MSIRAGMTLFVLAAMAVTPLAAQQAPAAAPAPAPATGADHVAAVKQSLQQSAAAIRQYEWVESTAVSVKGDVKSQKQAKCYYGADGKLQKTPLAGEPAGDARQPRGVRGRVAENKKEELSASMQEAVALVKQYVPPDPARIQAAKDAGRLSLTPPDAQGRVRLAITDYLKPGDKLTIDLNAAADRVSGLKVSTFTDSAKDAVGMTVAFGALSDGTVYASTVDLEVAAQQLAVKVENSGYRKLGS